MATISEKENVKERRVSSEVISLEEAVIAWLLNRFTEMPNESFKDMVKLMEILTRKETSSEEYDEIYETIREILFPHLVGPVLQIDVAEQTPEKLQNRANWIGDKVKEYRNKKELSQIELAKKSGLQQSQISRLEAGVHSPSFKTLEKIAKALDIDIGDLDPSH